MTDVNEIPLDVKLFPKQALAFNSPATEILYGGAAGGGKSYLMRVAAIHYALKIPGLEIYLFRQIREDLIRNHLEGPSGFKALLARWVDVGWVTLNDREIVFKNGSKIYLCHLKDESVVTRYQGVEIHLLLIDELTHFSESDYRYLRGRTRIAGIKLPPDEEGKWPKIIASANPGGFGHLWVKSFWIDNAPPLTIRKMPLEEGGMLRQFIPAQLQDNPALKYDEYAGKLMGLGSQALVKGWLFGDWNIVEGAFFDCFDSSKHIIKPFKIPSNWFRFRAFDWGSAAPSCVLWFAVADGEDDRFERGSLICYRELYTATGPNKGTKQTASELAKLIEKLEKNDGNLEGVADTAIFSNESDGTSVAERMYRATGIVFKRATKNRKQGWNEIRERLTNGPTLFMFDTCVNLIRTLPALQHSKQDPEDIDTRQEDHAADALRYACMSRPVVAQKKKQSKSIDLNSITIADLWKSTYDREPF